VRPIVAAFASSSNALSSALPKTRILCGRPPGMTPAAGRCQV
jgi:hypothetical protein